MNGDSVITAADRVILGYGDPKFYGGLSNTLTYGRFSLDLFFSFNYGNKIINAGNAYGGLAIGQANERATVLDRWTPTHTRSEEHTSELQSQSNLVCRLLLEKKKNNTCRNADSRNS